MAGKVMPWCKLYAEARTDKKLAILTLAERGVWTNLLCYASEQEVRGTFDATDRYDLALECADGDEDVLNSTIDKLLKVKHVIPADHDGHLVFRTFETRQAIKPSDRPEATRDRKRAQRARHADTPDVTPTSHHVTRDIAKKANVTRLDKRVRERERDRDPQFVSDGEGDPLAFAAASDDADGARPPAQPLTPKSPVNPLWDALAKSLDTKPETKDERSNWGRVVRQLKEARASPDEVTVRVQRMIAKWGREYVTISAIAKHWGEFAQERANERSQQQQHAANGTYNGRGGARGGAGGKAPPLADAHAPGNTDGDTDDAPDLDDGIYAAFVNRGRRTGTDSIHPAAPARPPGV